MLYKTQVMMHKKLAGVIDLVRRYWMLLLYGMQKYLAGIVADDASASLACCCSEGWEN